MIKSTRWLLCLFFILVWLPESGAEIPTVQYARGLEPATGRLTVKVSPSSVALASEVYYWYLDGSEKVVPLKAEDFSDQHDELLIPGLRAELSALGPGKIRAVDLRMEKNVSARILAKITYSVGMAEISRIGMVGRQGKREVRIPIELPKFGPPKPLPSDDLPRCMGITVGVHRSTLLVMAESRLAEPHRREEPVTVPRDPKVCFPLPGPCRGGGPTSEDNLSGSKRSDSIIDFFKPCTDADRKAWLAAEKAAAKKRPMACERAKKVARLKWKEKVVRWELRGKGNQLPLNELKAKLSQTRDKDCPWYDVRIDMGDASQSIGGLKKSQYVNK